MEETEDRINLGAQSGHALADKYPRVYFRTCLYTKGEQSTAKTVSQYLTTRQFLSLSEHPPLQHALAAGKQFCFLS